MNVIAHNLLAIAQEAPLVECRCYCGKHTGPAVMKICSKAPIILSSPHATYHPRAGRTKLADMFAGTLALQLARLIGVSALLDAHLTDEDPNDDTTGPFKRPSQSLRVRTRTGCMLDLHGMSPCTFCRRCIWHCPQRHPGRTPDSLEHRSCSMYRSRL
jgi:hypothetical protein